MPTPYFESLAAFLAMGGHALFVWLAYGATLLVLILYCVSLAWRKSRIMRTLSMRAWVEAGADRKTEAAPRDEETNAPAP